jgi:hypothetical protein
MSSTLLVATMSNLPVLAAAIGVNALASVLRIWIEQTSRTRRLDKALADAEPQERPDIIQACSQLEQEHLVRPESVGGTRRGHQHRRG